MTITPTYPGVYIQEIPSGVRTITGVQTSITAFAGRAPIGPVATPVLIASYGDYQRTFGGLTSDSSMSYSVRDFFLNGGAQAVIVRLYHAPSSSTTGGFAQVSVAAAAPIPALVFTAASPGAWGNSLVLQADTINIPSNSDISALYGAGLVQADFFNLTVTQTSPTGAVTTERFNNLTLKDPSPRRIDRVLAAQSQFVRVTTTGGAPISAIGTSGMGAAAVAAINGATPPVSFTQGADSSALVENDYFGGAGAEAGLPSKTGIYALENTDLFNLLVIPPDVRGQDGQPGTNVLAGALKYAFNRRAILLVDPPLAWEGGASVVTGGSGLASLGLSGTNTRNAALYYPHLLEADPLRQGQPDLFAPSGAVAGIIAATDAQRGVWKAPAGVDTGIQGIRGLSLRLTNADSGALNPLGVNALRTFPVSGSVVWGSRTLRGADQLADDYKYLPVRRLALYIEESLFRGTQWVVFEPNDTPLWAQIRLNVGSFMNDLFRKGVFAGTSPRDAVFVKCDAETTTKTDINNGIVNIVAGFAPLKPAEFVIISIQQLAGQNAS